jgi:hypothetical protein
MTLFLCPLRLGYLLWVSAVFVGILMSLCVSVCAYSRISVCPFVSKAVTLCVFCV